jgi:SAM-dependent methyltransferase
LFHGPVIPAVEAASVVNVHLHQFRPGGAVVDAAALASEASGQRGNSITRAPDTRPEPGSSARAALAQFQQQWATYRKLVESDCLCHRELGGILRSTLNDVFKSPFSFLDIACGDAFMMKTALRGTQVRHYHGIDLSQAALEIAAANLADLPFKVDLDHRDFVEAMLRRPEHADAAWCSLSIHHLATADKLKLMQAIRRATGSRGIFLLYEPTRRDGEDRPAWLDRFLRTNKPRWNVLTADEWEQIWHHVTTCDFPETGPVWCELGRQAGFGTARQVFVDPTDFFRLYRFEG